MRKWKLQNKMNYIILKLNKLKVLKKQKWNKDQILLLNLV